MGDVVTVNPSDDTLDRPPVGNRNKRSYVLAVVAIVIVVLLLTAPLIYNRFQEDEIEIDGLISDWADVPKFIDELEGQENANIDIAEYAVKDNGDSLNFYLSVKGRVMGGGTTTTSGADAMQMFLDTDRNSGTGYQVYGVGADYLINITGWDSVAHEATLYEWSGPAGTDLINFQSRSTVRVATSRWTLEAQVELSKINVSSRDEPVRVVMRTVDCLGNNDFADAAINQFPAALAFKYISGQSTNQFRLSAIAHHDDITLDRLSIRFEDYRGFPATGKATINIDGRSYPGTGPGQVSDVTFSPPLEFAAGETRTFQVISSLSGAAAVRPALLYSDDIHARPKNQPSVEVSIKPAPGYTYINTIPPPGGDIRIDGNFDDWL
ncbi:MAG: hypothetical protein KAS77_08465, partial [Thermoplasmata archaeon]|nr:hypothetical protein [Thermoplasmata archaeon]